jgi:hypothetical protein
LRLQGLVTLLTAYSLRNLVGSISHRQHSWDLPFGVPLLQQVSDMFPHQIDPPAVFSCRCSQCRSTGPARQAAAPGSSPCRKVRSNTDGFSIGHDRRTPLGFPLPGHATKTLVRISPDLLSHALSTRPRMILPTGVPESRSVFASLVRSSRQAENRRTSNPLRVSAPAQSAPFERTSIRAMSSPLVVPCVTADYPTIFGWLTSLYRSWSGSA